MRRYRHPELGSIKCKWDLQTELTVSYSQLHG